MNLRICFKQSMIFTCKYLTLLCIFYTSSIQAFPPVRNHENFTKLQTIDLNKLVPYVLPNPGFDKKINSSKQPYEQIYCKVEDYFNNNDFTYDQWIFDNKLSSPLFKLPSEQGVGNLPSSIPTKYKDFVITKGIHTNNYNLFFYGKKMYQSRFLVITDTFSTKVLYFLDFTNYTQSPKIQKEDAASVYQQLTWASLDKSGILYVSTGHNTYAKSSFGQNAYLTAINLNNKTIQWRSEPLVSNCNFLIIGDNIFSGYGFTDEQDYLYTINKYTGAIMARELLKTAPDWILNYQKNLFVRTYDTDYEFLLSDQPFK